MISAFDTLAALHAAEVAELEAENGALRAQRDALLAALHHVEAIAKTGFLHQSSLSHDGLVELLAEAAQAAREAIAAAKGE